MTAENKNATFVSVNLKEAFGMDSIKKHSNQKKLRERVISCPWRDRFKFCVNSKN